jgi:hypothetical protein
MDKDTVTMSMKQLNRFDILSKANAGFITVRGRGRRGLLGANRRRFRDFAREYFGALGALFERSEFQQAPDCRSHSLYVII